MCKNNSSCPGFHDCNEDDDLNRICLKKFDGRYGICKLFGQISPCGLTGTNSVTKLLIKNKYICANSSNSAETDLVFFQIALHCEGFPAGGAFVSLFRRVGRNVTT